MKKQTAANISVALALALWPMAFIIFGVILNKHEPNVRGVMLAEIMMPLAFIFLLTAAWLAGYSYAESKKRATFSTLCSVVYIFTFAWLIWQ